jgi:hypothetical protein
MYSTVPTTKRVVVSESSLGNAMLEGLALQVLHHDERLAFLLVNVVNGANVGMVQRGGRTGFSPTVDRYVQGLI